MCGNRAYCWNTVLTLRSCGATLETSTPFEHHPAAGRLLEAGDHLQQRRLAAAGRAEQGEELASPDREVGLLDGDEVAELLAHGFQHDHVVAVRVSSISITFPPDGPDAPGGDTLSSAAATTQAVGPSRHSAFTHAVTLGGILAAPRDDLVGDVERHTSPGEQPCETVGTKDGDPAPESEPRTIGRCATAA